MANSNGILLITGPPGVGKTTLLRKIIENLSGKSKLQGFYTEEVRVEGQRIGFDVVTLKGQRGILAREKPPMDKSHYPKVGKYCVYVKEFENLTLPLFAINSKETPPSLWIIDEVGKMELCSKLFESAVKDLIQKQVPMVAIIPQQSRQLLPLVEKLKQQTGAVIYHVTKINRNDLITTITKYLTK